MTSPLSVNSGNTQTIASGDDGRDDPVLLDGQLSLDGEGFVAPATYGGVTVSAETTQTVNGTGSRTGTVSMAPATTLTADGETGVFGTVTMTPATTQTVDGSGERSGSVAVAPVVTQTVDGTASRTGSVAIAPAVTVTGNGQATKFGSLTLSPAVTETVDGEVIVPLSRKDTIGIPWNDQDEIELAADDAPDAGDTAQGESESDGQQGGE